MFDCSLCEYPEMMLDLVDFHNIATYTIVAVSAGTLPFVLLRDFLSNEFFFRHICAHCQMMVNFYRAAWNATRSYDEISVCPSVRPSVCLSNACIVIKRKKNQSRFLYHAKEHSL